MSVAAFHVGPLISCKDASRLISQIQEGHVPPGRRLRVRLHLIFCEACKEFERQVRFLRVMMRRYRQ
jgi:hypothetical protein